MGMVEAAPSLTRRLEELERRVRDLEFLLSATKTAVTVRDVREAKEDPK